MPITPEQFSSKIHLNTKQFERTIEKLPVRVGKLLGCGNIGCTYAGDPGSVVKITADKSELEPWNQVIELDERGIDLSSGIPVVYALGEIPGAEAYWIHREEVEPLVLGEEFRLSKRTIRWLFGSDAHRFENKQLMLADDWSFVGLLERLSGNTIPRSAWNRAALLDEDLHKLYVLTDLTEFAERQPSNMQDVWLEAYIKDAMSTRVPLKGIGEAISTIVSETGDLWITDIHLGNVGWRLRGKPQLLVYDWLTADMIPNGTGCA